MFLLIFVVNLEDVIEHVPSIMPMIGGCLETCSLVAVSPVDTSNILRVQILWDWSHSMVIDT